MTVAHFDLRDFPATHPVVNAGGLGSGWPGRDLQAFTDRASTIFAAVGCDLDSSGKVKARQCDGPTRPWYLIHIPPSTRSGFILHV